jgi:glyceraldehyde-3-phosphate dehydrogenase/erythrose-4-phosphate dehydrogenase
MVKVGIPGMGVIGKHVAVAIARSCQEIAALKRIAQ